MYRRQIFVLLLIGLFALSGCGQRDTTPTETTDNYAWEESGVGPEESMEENDGTSQPPKEPVEESSGSSESLPSPKEIPVNTTALEIHYHSGDIELASAQRCCVSDGENLYIAFGGKTELYVMPLGADEHFTVPLDNPEGLFVCNIAMDVDGRIHLLMTDADRGEWFIWRLDEEYQTDKTLDISAYFETSRVPRWFLTDKDGAYYLQWDDGIIIDSEGVLKYRFAPPTFDTRWIYGAAVGKDGRIYLVYGDGDEKWEIGELDVENCTIKQAETSLSFPGSENFIEMSGGTDTNLLLYSPYSGIWACDTETGVRENRVSLSEIGIDSSMTSYPLTFLADGRLLLLVIEGDDNCLKYIPAGR